MPCKRKNKAEETVKDAGRYPGVAVNSADNNKTERTLEKERTATLNNNPRNTDL